MCVCPGRGRRRQGAACVRLCASAGLRACVPVRAAETGSSRDPRHMTPPAPSQRADRPSLSLLGEGRSTSPGALGLCGEENRFQQGMVLLGSRNPSSAPGPGV